MADSSEAKTIADADAALEVIDAVRARLENVRVTFLHGKVDSTHRTIEQARDELADLLDFIEDRWGTPPVRVEKSPVPEALERFLRKTGARARYLRGTPQGVRPCPRCKKELDTHWTKCPRCGAGA